MKKEFRHIYSRFYAFGGWRLIKEYIRMGLLKGISKQIWQVMLGHRSWKEVVSSVYTQVDSFLIAKYTPMMLRLKEQYKQAQLGESAQIVWCCWLHRHLHSCRLVSTHCVGISTTAK